MQRSATVTHRAGLIVSLLALALGSPIPSEAQRPDIELAKLVAISGDPVAVAHQLLERVGSNPETAVPALLEVLEYLPHVPAYRAGDPRSRDGAGLALARIDRSAAICALEHAHRWARDATARGLIGAAASTTSPLAR